MGVFAGIPFGKRAFQLAFTEATVATGTNVTNWPAGLVAKNTAVVPGQLEAVTSSTLVPPPKTAMPVPVRGNVPVVNRGVVITVGGGLVVVTWIGVGVATGGVAWSATNYTGSVWQLPTPPRIAPPRTVNVEPTTTTRHGRVWLVSV